MSEEAVSQRELCSFYVHHSQFLTLTCSPRCLNIDFLKRGTNATNCCGLITMVNMVECHPKGLSHSKLEFHPFTARPDVIQGSGNDFLIHITAFFVEFQGGKQFHPVEACCGRGLWRKNKQQTISITCPHSACVASSECPEGSAVQFDLKRRKLTPGF